MKQYRWVEVHDGQASLSTVNWLNCNRGPWTGSTGRIKKPQRPQRRVHPPRQSRPRHQGPGTGAQELDMG